MTRMRPWHGFWEGMRKVSQWSVSYHSVKDSRFVKEQTDTYNIQVNNLKEKYKEYQKIQSMRFFDG